MNNQVLSIEQMQELIELGIDTSKAFMRWRRTMNYITGEWDSGTLMINSSVGTYPSLEYIPTFTLQNILEILPKPCYINCIDNDFYQCEITTENGSTTINGFSVLNAAFSMLKLCKQNNYI